MAYLEILTRNQLDLVATSFILGLIFGASCDIIRITYILGGLLSYERGKLVERKGILPFCCRLLTDLCAALFLGAAASVYVYWANDGRFRWFMAAFAAAGFCLWRFCFSRPLLFAADKLTGLLRKTVRILLIVPVLKTAALVRAAGRAMLRLLRRFAALTVGKAAARICRRIRRKRGIRRTETARARLAEDVWFDGEEGTRP